MEDWKGPAIWIYNDAEFTNDDFGFLIKLGIGGKSNDITKIGKFGLGFNCAFHITDVPSFVSGKYIAFLDPHVKFLPPSGFPLEDQKDNNEMLFLRNIESCSLYYMTNRDPQLYWKE
ncbi:hypothetical protein C1645_745971 [Glomus cerebriforme]|uniref:Sacsin/Nov domain-containing protein n=1 Tax=Glomus cerebriforme TaxID=658196 RepID=A0A397SAI6_9GLOM|nr:hypothetical protein C1645_745971 [Glomus cerebriforme]